MKWRNERHGFKWDYKDNGKLDFESVRYECINCGHPHVEHDKDVLFATEHGAEWKPAGVSNDPTIRSYHPPAFYSPVGMQPWSKCVSQVPIHRFDQPRLNEQVSKLDCGDDTREFVKAELFGVPFIIDNTNVIDGLEMRSPDGKKKTHCEYLEKTKRR